MQGARTIPADGSSAAMIAGGGVESHALLAVLQEQAATQLRGQTDHA
jgi:hypothetical protein